MYSDSCFPPNYRRKRCSHWQGFHYTKYQQEMQHGYLLNVFMLFELTRVCILIIPQARRSLEANKPSNIAFVCPLCRFSCQQLPVGVDIRHASSMPAKRMILKCCSCSITRKCNTHQEALPCPFPHT